MRIKPYPWKPRSKTCNAQAVETGNVQIVPIVKTAFEFQKPLFKPFSTPFYSQKLCFANRLAGSLPSNFLKIFKNFSGWNVRFVLAECLDRLGKRSDRLWSARIIFVECLADPQCFSGVLWDPAFLYTIFLKLYIFKSRSHALCTSVCRFIWYGIYTWHKCDRLLP